MRRRKSQTKPQADQPRALSIDHLAGFNAGLKCASDYMKAQADRTVNPEADPREVWRHCCDELERVARHGLLKPEVSK